MLKRFKRFILLRWIYPFLDHYLLRRYKVWGDRSRLRLAGNALVCDALFNLASGTITIEDWVFFGHHVCVLTGTHDFTRFGPDRQLAIPSAGRDVLIRTGVWIGSNVTILGPCQIGEHAVVAAGSLVREDVPPYAILAGVPAKIIGDVRNEQLRACA